MKRSTLAVMASLVAVLLAAAPAAAAPAGVSGVAVTLLSGGFPILATVTGADGTFLLSGVDAGSYRLQVQDPMDGFLVDAALEVPAFTDVPGLVTDDPEAAVGVALSAWLGAAPEPPPPPSVEGFSIDAAVLRPKKWNPNYLHSMGKVHVTLWGEGLEMVESVALRSELGEELTTTDIVLDPIEGTATAFFRKTAAYATLIPLDTASGTLVPVTLAVAGPAGELTFDTQVLVKYKTKVR